MYSMLFFRAFFEASASYSKIEELFYLILKILIIFNISEHIGHFQGKEKYMVSYQNAPFWGLLDFSCYTHATRLLHI